MCFFFFFLGDKETNSTTHKHACLKLDNHRDRQTNVTDRKLYGNKYREMGSHIRQTGRQADRHTEGQTNRHANRHTDRQSERQTNKERNKQEGNHT